MKIKEGEREEKEATFVAVLTDVETWKDVSQKKPTKNVQHKKCDLSPI